MILLDANLLIYAHVTDFGEHEAARGWLDRQLTESPKVGFAWPSLLAFVRLVSNPRVFERPCSVAAAWEQVESWLAAESSWVPTPTNRHCEIMARLFRHCDRSALVPDAHLAALAVEHGLTLYSADGDFARFPEVTWVNPLAG